MIAAMVNEISLAKILPGSAPEPVTSIYFGGGTPSILSIAEITRLLENVSRFFEVTEGAEITLEANPDDITAEKLKEWKAAGINRFSIGVQSFIPEDLEWMNRAHNARQAYNCIMQVRDAGFDNFSVDLIYGTPGLSNDGWKKNVETLISMDVPHLSCYALTVEPGTALRKMVDVKKKEDVDHEKQALQFLLLMDWLADAGYEHYEISNFAKPGYRSRHNSSYWQGKNYIGIGPSAHSFTGYSRRWNVNNNALYCQSLSKNIIPFEEEILSEVQRLNEYIMTSLRTIEGIDISYIEKKFGDASSRRIQEASKKFIDNNNIVAASGQKLVLTKQGKLFADGIAADLFF